MFVKAIEITAKAMFPIFSFTDLGNNQAAIGVGGTGFFVDDEGTFVTTAHIFDDPDNKYFYWGNLPDEVINPRVEIEELFRDDERDIFIGKVPISDATPYVEISGEIEKVGRSICIGGYPLAQVSLNGRGEIELGGVRKYFQPSFILDKANSRTQTLSGKVRTHSGYFIRDEGLFGMSGGPVFNTDGVVVGMQGSITKPRVSSSGDRRIEIVNACVIASPIILEVLQQYAESQLVGV